MTYEYRHAKIDRVVDGDTVEMTIDMGNRIAWTNLFRLNGIDTPEKGQAGYALAIEYLKTLIALPLAYVQTHKPDKYGRWLCDLWVIVDNGTLHVNKMMVSEGHAKEYFGGKK